MMSSASHATIRPIGEVQCLICGQILAEAIESREDRRQLLRRAARHSGVEVQIVGRQGLHCRHCGGRALMQPFLDTREAIAWRRSGARVAAA